MICGHGWLENLFARRISGLIRTTAADVQVLGYSDEFGGEGMSRP
jgi:hypothetical protein